MARHEQVNTCAECAAAGLNCKDGKACNPVRELGFRNYGGIRLTSDGFDCALPVAIDTHSHCSYDCLYCFADNVTGHAYSVRDNEQIGETSLRRIEALFKGGGSKVFRKALKFDNRNANGYTTPVQVGALTDPCDRIEQQSGWLLKFIDLAIKHNQPVRMSTKGAIFLIPEYLERIKQAPHLFWVAFSIITSDDGLSRKVDKGCPDTSTRLRAMEELSKAGVKTSLRFRPVIPGISDRGKDPHQLIDRAANAGAQAISYEVVFYPTRLPKDKQGAWSKLSFHAGTNLKALYNNFGSIQSCTRPPYTWTEPIMHAIRDRAHENGMVVGVSAPDWKQLSDVGCCCGIKPDDPVFGNWERENATNAVVGAKQQGPGAPIKLADIMPPWAFDITLGSMVNLGAGPKVAQAKRFKFWGDKLREIWNNPTLERSPVNYFQGAVEPTGETDENGDLIYFYKGLERQYKKTSWQV